MLITRDDGASNKSPRKACRLLLYHEWIRRTLPFVYSDLFALALIWSTGLSREILIVVSVETMMESELWSRTEKRRRKRGKTYCVRLIRKKCSARNSNSTRNESESWFRPERQRAVKSNNSTAISESMCYNADAYQQRQFSSLAVVSERLSCAAHEGFSRGVEQRREQRLPTTLKTRWFNLL